MNSINKLIKSFAIKSNLSISMVARIDLLTKLFDEILIISNKKVYLKIINSLSKIFSHHSKKDSQIKDFNYYFVDCNNSDIELILRFLSCYFHLLNQCEIEEINYKNSLKSKRSNFSNPIKDSISDAIKFLVDNKITFRKAKNIMQGVLFEPTLTSHPTEFRRTSLLKQQNEILKNVNSYLFENYNQTEKTLLNQKIRNQIYIFMNTDDLRSVNILPEHEIKNSIFLMFNSAWESVPMIYNDIRNAFMKYYNEDYKFKKNINFCTWIGGDRDGNPNITSQLTNWALKFQRKQILTKYIQSIDNLFHELSLAQKRDLKFERGIKKDLEKITLSKEENLRLKNEPIRLKLYLIKFKLNRTLIEIENDQLNINYNYKNFENDLLNLEKHIKSKYPIDLFKNSTLEKLIIRAKTFQFNLLQMDIRQHSDCHEKFIDEMLNGKYIILSESQKQEKISKLLNDNKKIIDIHKLCTFSQEIYNTFKVVIENLQYHSQSIKSYIVSMTHQTSDVLEVLLIFDQVKKDLKVKGNLTLNITPLYETINDLENAPILLDDLLNNSLYKSHLKRSGNYQEVMLGYSDSNKDGGIFMANYCIHSCLRNVDKVFKKHSLEYSIFHGRGGSISRGGGKSNQAIRSFPKNSIKQRLRMTEQGEIISYRYGNSNISKRHLEQILSALIKNSIKINEEDKLFNELKVLADSTFENYRNNIVNIKFWKFFIKSTPINYISKLKISSRPSSRSKLSLNKLGIDEIRAIPWVSSWIQTRYNISGWFGIGKIINEIIESGDLESLQNIYNQSSFFRNVMDNITFEMARARIPISKQYSKINNYNEIHKMIEREFELIRKSYLLISKSNTLLERNPIIENSIKFRNPTADLINIIQSEYLRKLSRNSQKSNVTNEIIMSSINGMAAAMQTTG